ncbi:uncharacterized protein [Procambarus clarkii]|uniref:uncharacterized protein isoform X2 n=1 Tax=Procambarus clarkii TaxID=6728 RepID=UPI003743172C
MVCLPFKPAAGTNVPANIRIVDEAHTKIFPECGLKSSKVPVSWRSCLNRIRRVIMIHGVRLLYSAKGNLQKWVILWSCLGLLDLLFI